MKAFQGKKIPSLTKKTDQTLNEIRNEYCSRSISGDCGALGCTECLYGDFNADLFSKWYNQKK